MPLSVQVFTFIALLLDLDLISESMMVLCALLARNWFFYISIFAKTNQTVFLVAALLLVRLTRITLHVTFYAFAYILTLVFLFLFH